jgi:hypothetical protein
VVHPTADQADADAELLELIRAAAWRTFQGGVGGRGVWIPPHQYTMLKDAPALYQAIRARLKRDDAWSATFDGRRYTYTRLGDSKYWLSAGRGGVLMLNRQRLDQPTDGPRQLALW